MNPNYQNEIGNNRNGVRCDICHKKFDWVYAIAEPLHASDPYHPDHGKGERKCAHCRLETDVVVWVECTYRY